jgi:L-arabinose isomerase
MTPVRGCPPSSAMLNLNLNRVWFVTGSQHLYGPQVLEQVAANAQQMANALAQSKHIPVHVEYKPVVKTPEEIHALCLDANNSQACVGLIFWMHTFSPAKMWIAGLSALKKPFLHLHTQFNRDLPWATIDMDFMNLNQSAHGDREFGFMASRLRLNRHVVVGHWAADETQNEIGAWTRVACAWHDSQNMKIARIGDNMRHVAVTEGDKVQAQKQFGYAVNGYGVGEVVNMVNQVGDAEIKNLVAEYEAQYLVADELRAGGARHAELQDAARIELGLRYFLRDGNFQAFTDTFEDLHGLKQLPGIAVQRLMADGYGFGAEGDWKTAALVRSMKVMSAGLDGGTSFMEDYTYHLNESGMLVLGAHMLEICPTIANETPRAEIYPLGIGGKADPVRLVFNTRTGPALNASVIDLGNRFRMILNTVEVVPPQEPLPKLPVARALWIPEPNLKTAAAAWIYAGGAHHTGFSLSLTPEHLQMFADMAGVECVTIDDKTNVNDFKKELRWNDCVY